MKAIPTLNFTFLLIILILISGCSTNEVSEEPVVVDEMIVTFKPENCEYLGPTVIQHGEIKVIFDNQTDKNLIYDIFLLPDGKSWQDIVDILSGGGKNNVGMPEWAVLQPGKINIKDTREKVYNLESGSYALVCSEITPTGGFIDWLGSPLEVK